MLRDDVTVPSELPILTSAEPVSEAASSTSSYSVSRDRRISLQKMEEMLQTRSAYSLRREPIHILHYHLDESDSLFKLLRDVQAIHKSAKPYIPDLTSIRHDLASHDRKEPLDRCFHPVAASDKTTIDENKFRHRRTQDIFTAGTQCGLRYSSEAEWDTRVRGPVLDLAVGFAKGALHQEQDTRIFTREYDRRAFGDSPAYFVENRNVTVARLRPDFRNTEELAASEVKADWGVFIRATVAIVWYPGAGKATSTGY